MKEQNKHITQRNNTNTTTQTQHNTNTNTNTAFSNLSTRELSLGNGVVGEHLVNVCRRAAVVGAESPAHDLAQARDCHAAAALHAAGAVGRERVKRVCE